MYIKILPIPTLTAAERAQAISAELFAISRPPQVRHAADVSNYLFGWVAHPTEDEAVLFGQADYIIRVHPDNNINGLVALFPELSEAEKTALTTFISNSQSFSFSAILPSNTVIISQEEFDTIFNHAEQP